MKKSEPIIERPQRRRGFMLFVAAGVFGIVARLIQMQLFQTSHYEAEARENQIRLIPVSAPRGLIVDRNGKTIARSRPSYVCALIPSNVRDVDATLTSLAKILMIPQSVLAKRLYHHHGVDYANFDDIVANEPFGPVILADELTPAQTARLAESLNDLAGVDLEAQPVRNYPNGMIASHMFGYVGQITEEEYATLRSEGYSPNDVVGKDGLESTYDRYLRGKSGGEQIEVDAQGRPVRKLSFRPSIPGDSLVLSVDWPLQSLVEATLHKQLALWSKRTGRRLTGAVVVEDAQTGGILALASQPNFDPNDFSLGIGEKRYARYLNDPTQPLYDRAIAAATATGSTFKLVTGSAAITEHLVDPAKSMFDSGSYYCHGVTFSDIAAGGAGWINFPRALAASSDGYFYRLADLLGHERLRRYALDFGLDSRTGIDIPGEYPGNWPTNEWSMKVYHVPLEPSDVCQLGIGQGAMQATPLQMAGVAAVVANGGTLYRPHILSLIRAPDGSIIRRFDPEIVRKVPVSESALASVREGMLGVTGPGGTAYGFGIPGLPFGGKTGTVETDGGKGPNTTWFVAFAPADHPKISLAVFMERSGNYGASVAAPIAQAIIAGYFHKPIPPTP